MPVTTEDTAVTAHQTWHTSLYKCLVISLSPGQPRRGILTTDNASSISAISLCSSRPGRCCIMSCCMTQRAPALMETHFHRFPSRQAQQGLYCSFSGRWCLAVAGRTWHISSSGRGTAEVLPAAGTWRLMEQDWQSTWAGQEGHIAELWAWEPQVLHTWVLRANLPQRNAQLLLPNHSQ